jgi:hypothetical protein
VHRLFVYFTPIENNLFFKFLEIVGGGSFSPLMAVILRENKLTSPNYVDWKWNLNIILTVKEYKYILYNPCPVIRESFTNKEREAEKV